MTITKKKHGKKPIVFKKKSDNKITGAMVPGVGFMLYCPKCGKYYKPVCKDCELENGPE